MHTVVMIGGLAQHGYGHEAYRLFLQMRREGFESNAFTFSIRPLFFLPCAVLRKREEVSFYVAASEYEHPKPTRGSGYCPSQVAIESFRSQAVYVDFMKQWNLGVYYTLRFQEIASALDTALATTFAALAQGNPKTEDVSLGLALQPSAVLWDCLQRCWQEDVFMKAVSDKFFKLTLQLLSRYSTWLSAGLSARKTSNTERARGGEWSLTATAEDFLLVSHDVKVLGLNVKGSYVKHVLHALDPSPGEVLAVVEKSIIQGADLLMEIVPALTDVLTETLADKCVEVLKQAKGITTTYRMTNKPLPTRHSPYVSSILQPLKAFLDGDRVLYLREQAQNELLGTVVEKITTQYDEQAREIINTGEVKGAEPLKRLDSKLDAQGETSIDVRLINPKTSLQGRVVILMYRISLVIGVGIGI